MKHYVLGLVFNHMCNRVLLIEKRRPKWQVRRWNGIGGKIDPTDAKPENAMARECEEETGLDLKWYHKITFVCPGGTVFVYCAFTAGYSIAFDQLEDEQIIEFDIANLPEKIMGDLKWMIPICLSTLQTPIIVYKTDLGVER